MKTMACLGITVLLVAAAAPGGSEKAQEFFLCIDTSKGSSQHDILVYTYINGKKTECMPRSELLALCSRASSGQSESSRALREQERYVDSCKAAYREAAALQGKNLSTRDFKDARLWGVDFSNANLESADFRGADLRNANFTNANLRAAYLKGADLRGANLTGADLYGAYLNKADLRGVRGFTIDMVRMVNTLHEAVLDTLFLEELHYCCKDKLAKASWYWHNNAWADERAKKRNARSARSIAREPQTPPPTLE